MGLPNPSRETRFSGANADRGMIHFLCSADHEQDWQPYPVDPYTLALCKTIHIRGQKYSDIAALRTKTFSRLSTQG